MRAIIVDDEKAARHSLETLLTDYCEGVEIVGLAENVPEAVKLIDAQKPDVVFLDIEMPGYSGFELFECFEEVTFRTVFVTAYEKYALQAFKVAALDYITKPVQISHLRQAVERIDRLSVKDALKDKLATFQETIGRHRKARVSIPTNDGLQFVDVNDIIAFEADGSYTLLHTIGQRPVVVSKKLHQFENLLEHSQFFKTHRSFIINTNHVTHYSRNENILTMVQGLKVRLARDRKKAFEEWMG